MTMNLSASGSQQCNRTSAYKEYSERYLRFAYELGYPAEEDRLEFQRIFYQANPRGPVKHKKSPLRHVLYDFHRALQRGIVPAWVKDDPRLLSLFAKVVVDYNEKYGTSDVKSSVSAPLNYEPEKCKKLETEMIFQTRQDTKATAAYKWKQLFSKPTTKQINVKQEIESNDKPAFLGMTTAPTVDKEKQLMMGTLKQLEQEKDNEIEDWKRKHDEMLKKNEEEQKNLSMKIAQMEEEHKAEKMKLLDDKMKVMAQLLEEKDRTIELLSFQ